MAATFSFSETYGTSPGTTTDTSYVNLLSADAASGSDTTTNPTAYPITKPASGYAYSYERYVRGHWTGSFSSISNVKFWLQSWTPPTGVELYAKDLGSQTYSTPTVPSSTTGFTVNTGWDSEGEALTLGYASNYSDYVVLMLRVSDAASSGAVNTWTLRFSWLEV